jgi:hypothetical protein
MALVGTEQSDSNSEEIRTVRMYNLSSLASIAIWAAAQSVSIYCITASSNLTFGFQRPTNQWIFGLSLEAILPRNIVLVGP